MNKIETISDFLAQKRIAIVGLSHEPKDFSRSLAAEFRQRGYEVMPVNPLVAEIDGSPCFAQLTDMQPVPDAVLFMTSPTVTESLVPECAELGVKRVWMYRATGKGAVSKKAVEFCAANGIATVVGECPLMFLRDGAWFHRLHGFVKKITGTYPQ